MKAIVCDMCGRVILLEDDKPYICPSGVYRLVSDKGYASEVDLCENCAGNLVKVLRRMDGE